MPARTITESLALALIEKGTLPQPFRSLGPDGLQALTEWAGKVAKEPYLHDSFLWQVKASIAANAVGPRDGAVLTLLGRDTKSGKTETFLLPRQMFFWQVMGE